MKTDGSWEIMTDLAYGDFFVKLREQFMEKQPPHERALRVAPHMAAGLAVPNWA
jgi:hypothetical protein